MCETKDLYDFVLESNRIEGINSISSKEIKAAGDFLDLDEVKIADLERIVEIFQPGAELRLNPGMNVRVGNHTPPPGGPIIRARLEETLMEANGDHLHPCLIHMKYEDLHPFMDGNGRSGRILWAWQMLKHNHSPGLDLGFQHAFYYQVLEIFRCLRFVEAESVVLGEES
jgi:hypothetical protein